MLIKNALYNGFRLAVYVQQMQVVDSMLGESMYLILIFFFDLHSFRMWLRV